VLERTEPEVIYGKVPYPDPGMQIVAPLINAAIGG
jgi:hypothetical protein